MKLFLRWIYYQLAMTAIALFFLLVLIVLHLEESTFDNYDDEIGNILTILRQEIPSFQSVRALRKW